MNCLKVHIAGAGGVIACTGFDGNPCCQEHTGCDAACIEVSWSGEVRVYLVEVKRGKLSLSDAGKALQQLDHCRAHTAIPRGAQTVYTVIADSYTQQAVKLIQRYSSKRRIPVKRLKPSDSRLSTLALDIVKAGRG